MSRRRGAQRRHVFRGSKFFPRLSLRAPFSLLASYQIPMGSLCAFAGSKGRMSYADPNNYYLASSRAVPIGSTRSQIQTITQLPLARSWWPLRTPLRGPAVIPLTRIQAFASPPLHAPSGPLARSRWAFDTLLNNPAEVPLTWIQATASPPAIRSYWASGALQAGSSHASEGSSGVTPYADPNYHLATSPPHARSDYGSCCPVSSRASGSSSWARQQRRQPPEYQ